MLVNNSNNNLRIAVGNDHAGYEMKIVVHKWLKEQGYKIVCYGAGSPFSDSYPDFVKPVVKGIETEENDIGILIYGDSENLSFPKNKYSKINAELCWNKENARHAREYKNANILYLPGKFLSDKAVVGILEGFLQTKCVSETYLKRTD
jgi:ribose 5-phosphate isomerase B